ncbi:diacylglycerol O-acyltransferase 3-1-like [Cornus florida]|uniref:diacylglycerol O-acyltransferase 3-1-like n=1 Tax=Cornus florida TaxID=4283 RepID=UPI0028991688|nr:diacylglycerol O-acyltransferase 3-1-like [Cornus florida]
MAVSGMVFQPIPSFFGVRISTHSPSSSKASFSGVSVNAGARLSGCLRLVGRENSRVYTKPKTFSGFLDSGFWDCNDHVQYYYNYGSWSTIRCRCGKREKEKRISGMVATKKMKFLKRLSSDLSMFSEMGCGLGSEHGSIDEDKEKKMILEAAEILLEKLQQLRANEKELKRKKKEEKSRLKTAKMQNRLRVSSDSSSSDSSSKSSDSECDEEVVDISRLQNPSLAQPILNELLQPVTQEATSTLPNTPIQEGNTTEERGFEVRDSQSHDQECCTGTSTSCSNEGSTRASSTKIEVCMGGKCRKSGAAALLEKFQRALGVEGAVAGCKCMGKCRNGPNVRVLNRAGRVQGQGIDDSVRAQTNPLCTGVALEDMDSILSKYFGETHKDYGSMATAS